jgi:orotidine-5'-phosphate decarboxylase
MIHFADRLAAAVRAKGNAVCVGLDPRWDSLPLELRQRHGDSSLAAVASAYEEFCSIVLDIVAPLVPAVKPQSAFFEACGPDGLAVLQRLLRKARDLNLVTILDGKRNDIASTASAYADATFGGTRLAGREFPVWEADALTINPYLGRDAVEPFMESARRVAAGLFVLVRTSNPGAGQFQDLLVSPLTQPSPPQGGEGNTSQPSPPQGGEGNTSQPSPPQGGEGKGEGGDTAPRPLYQHVGEAVAAWTRENLGLCGLGDVGAVVGATYPDELALLRKLLPEVIFLVPGFGAQGGKADDVAPAFRSDGLGALVNSSRGILFPFQPEEPRWQAHIEDATRRTIVSVSAGLDFG